MTKRRSGTAAKRRTRPANASRTRAASARSARPAAVEGTPADILDAALAVFAERGFDGARTREIAARAGANLGLLTYYFGDKERLWREAVTRAFARLREELGDVLAADADGADPRAGLDHVVRRFVRFVARNPEFMQLMNDEGKRDGPRMRWLVDRFVGPAYEALRPRVERARASGALPAIPAASLHYLVLGAAGLIFSQAAECKRLMGVDPRTDAFADAHADALLQLIAPASRAASD
ncbi:MAG TPA: TetR family transcriptional regulator [Candidatus Binatia bacterium]|nr:TetR family transcriptional regulator [Candidatus Binatia bacterium]